MWSTAPLLALLLALAAIDAAPRHANFDTNLNRVKRSLGHWRMPYMGGARRDLDGIDGSLIGRNLDSIGGSNLIGRDLDGIDGSLIGRSLDSIGGSNLIGRDLDGIDGSLIGRSLDLIGRDLDGIDGSLIGRRDLDGIDGSLIGRNLDSIGGGNLIGRDLDGIDGSLIGRSVGGPRRAYAEFGEGRNPGDGYGLAKRYSPPSDPKYGTKTEKQRRGPLNGLIPGGAFGRAARSNCMSSECASVMYNKLIRLLKGPAEEEFNQYFPFDSSESRNDSDDGQEMKGEMTLTRPTNKNIYWGPYKYISN